MKLTLQVELNALNPTINLIFVKSWSKSGKPTGNAAFNYQSRHGIAVKIFPSLGVLMIKSDT